jgi:hypothetical protein
MISRQFFDSMMLHRQRLTVLFFFCVLLFPTPAYAYLDPGTGNILIYVFVSLLTTVLYFAKNFWYSLRERVFSYKHDGTRAFDVQRVEGSSLIIFSEGKIYWSTFKPIVEALMKRKFPFRYISMDIEDPGLTIESEYMDSRYIGRGSAAFARAAAIRADVMLQTTANIGTPGYPMPLPRHVRCLAHVLHSIGGLALYYKHAQDTCNALLLMGDGDRESVRLLEEKRGLKQRECISAGVPVFDELIRRIKPKPEGTSDPPVLLIAPSWGEKNCLAYCGTGFIHMLLMANYSVIIRPHPFSLIIEKGFIDALTLEFQDFSNLRFDFAVDGSASLAEADMMISDKSGVRFDFAFLYERPVITLDVPLKNQEHFEISELEYVWENDVETKLGPVLSPERLCSLSEQEFLQLVESALQIKKSEIAQVREQSIANIGHSGAFIADWAIQKCAELSSCHSKQQKRDI